MEKLLILFDACKTSFITTLFYALLQTVPPDYARKDHLISLSVKSWNRSEMKSKKKGMRRRSNCRDHLCYLRLNQKY